MNVKNLEHINFSAIMQCFLKAFENYYVKMPTDHDYYRRRWKMANVKLNLSYGMFDGEELVGFIINAVDERNGVLTAFNTGTGVLPKYRGKRIVKEIYNYAIPDLIKNGFKKCALEVIKDNEIAIKAYKGIGFKIIKDYKCFSGVIPEIGKQKNYTLKKVDVSYFDWNTIPQDMYSWDNHINTLKRSNYHYYIISKEGKVNSYFVINPENGYVAQFNVLRRQMNWEELFQGIREISETIKMNNIEEREIDKIDYLTEINFKNTVDQFEMELYLD